MFAFFWIYDRIVSLSCGHGGIGRRVRFRFLWSKGCAGSSPVVRTMRWRGQIWPRHFSEIRLIGEWNSAARSEMFARCANMKCRCATMRRILFHGRAQRVYFTTATRSFHEREHRERSFHQKFRWISVVLSTITFLVRKIWGCFTASYFFAISARFLPHQRFGLWLEAIPKRELGTRAAPYFVSHPASPLAPLQHRASKWWRLTPFVYSVLASLVLTNPSPSAKRYPTEPVNNKVWVGAFIFARGFV